MTNSFLADNDCQKFVENGVLESCFSLLEGKTVFPLSAIEDEADLGVKANHYERLYRGYLERSVSRLFFNISSYGI